MEIETKTASLETFAVTIRALHVSNKQMTLAVFRQMPVGHEGLDCQLWGIVRYAIKDTGDEWLVFSLDGRLYRRAIDTDIDQKYARNTRRLEDIKAKTIKDWNAWVEDKKNVITIDTSRIEQYSQRLLNPQPNDAQEYFRRHIASMTKEIAEIQEKIPLQEATYLTELSMTEDWIADSKYDQETELKRAWHDKDLLRTLPQLFIAV